MLRISSSSTTPSYVNLSCVFPCVIFDLFFREPDIPTLTTKAHTPPMLTRSPFPALFPILRTVFEVVDLEQIATDLVTLMKAFYIKHPVFQAVPLWIFCESYGGKMVAVFASALQKAIAAGVRNLGISLLKL